MNHTLTFKLLSGLDAEKINDIIKRASEGSRFYQHKQRHQQHLDEKLEVMKKEASSFTEEQIKKATKQVLYIPLN